MSVNETDGSTGAAAPSARVAIETAIRESDGGLTPERWPAQYEPAIEAAIAVLEPGEQVLAAWRMRTTGPRELLDDVGLVVFTDRRVLGPDHSPAGDGMFQAPTDQVAEILVAPHKLGRTKIGDEIQLLGEGHAALGSDASPAAFQIFAAGKDPSHWNLRVRQGRDLVAVQQSMAKLMPKARSTKGNAVAVKGSGAAKLAAPVASSLRAQTGVNAPTSRFRPIMYLIVGICGFAILGIAALSFITDDCTPNGMSYTCISPGSSGVQLQTTLNIPLLIGALILALLFVWIGVRGIRRANQAREHHRQGTP